MKANLAITYLLEDIANVAYFMDDFALGLRCVLRLYQYIISAKPHADEVCAKQKKALITYAENAIPGSEEEQIYRKAANSTSAARALYHQADQVPLLRREVQQAQQRLAAAYDDMMPTHHQSPKRVHWPDEDKLKAFSPLDPEAEAHILHEISTIRALNEKIREAITHTASLQAEARHLIKFFEFILKTDQEKTAIATANKKIDTSISKIKEAICENKKHDKQKTLLHEYRDQILLKITTVIATVQSIYYQDDGRHWWRLRRVLSKMCADCKAPTQPPADVLDQTARDALRRKTQAISKDMLSLANCTATASESAVQLIAIYERILKANRADVVISEIENTMMEHSKQCLDDAEKIRGYFTVVDALQSMKDLYHQGGYGWQRMRNRMMESHHSLSFDITVGRIQALDKLATTSTSVSPP